MTNEERNAAEAHAYLTIARDRAALWCIAFSTVAAFGLIVGIVL